MLNKESKEKQRATKPDLIKLSVAELLAKKVEKREHIGEITKCVIDLEPMKTDDLYVLTCGHTVSSAAVRGSSTCPTCREPYSGPMTTTVLRPVMRDGVQVMEPITRVIEVKPVQNYMLTQVLDVGKEIEDIDAELEKRAKEQPGSQNQTQIKELTGKITLLEGQIKERDAKIETLKKSLFSQAEALSSTKDQLKERDTRELLESKQSQLKTAQTISSKDLEINELRNEVRKLKEQLSVMKAQLTKLEQPLEQSSAAPDMKHSQSGPVERKGKGKNKGKQTGAVSHSMAQPSVEENPAQQVAAHDAKPLQPVLPAGDVSAPAREEAKAAGQELNKWHARLGMLKMPVFAIINIGIGVILSKLTNFSPSDRVVNQQEPTTSIIPSVGTPNITSISGLKPYLPTLLAVNPEQALPDLAKLFGGVLTPEQFSQLIQEFEHQQAVNATGEQEAEDVTEELIGETDAETGASEISSLPLSEQGKKSESKTLSSEDNTQPPVSVAPPLQTQEEQFALVEKYFKSEQAELILKGHDILKNLVEIGYPPAQRKYGYFLCFEGDALNKKDKLNQGMDLLKKAADRGDQQAGKLLSKYRDSYCGISAIDTELHNATGEKWKGKKLLAARFQKAAQKISAQIPRTSPEIRAKDKSMEDMRNLANVEHYAPAQFWYGVYLVRVSEAVNDEALRNQGIERLIEAAKQGVQNAKEYLLHSYWTAHRFQDEWLTKIVGVEAPALPIQTAIDNGVPVIADKIHQIKASTLVRQQERFAICEQNLASNDRELILKGRGLLKILSEEGYLPAQLRYGTDMIEAGTFIRRDDIVKRGVSLILTAAKQGDQDAFNKLRFQVRTNGTHIFTDRHINIASFAYYTDWKSLGNLHLNKRYQLAIEKIEMKNENMLFIHRYKNKDEAYKELKDLAELDNYPPAQYVIGALNFNAGKLLNDESLVATGLLWLKKAGEQGVKNAADFLKIDPIAKEFSTRKLSYTLDKPLVLSPQTAVDNSVSTAVDKVSEVKNSSSESQEERFKTSEQDMMSSDPVLISKGNDLLIALAEEGYPPAQLKHGIYMVFAGHYIAREDLVNKGLALVQAAADQNYQTAIDYWGNNDPKQAKIDIDAAVQDAAGQKWAGSKHLEKRFQAIVEKVYGVSLEGFASAQNQQSKDEAFSELEKLARVENYAPAQYCLGYSFLFAGKYLNSPAFIGRGVMWLEKAAEQGVKNASDLLATDDFTKDHIAASQRSSTAKAADDDFNTSITAYKLYEQGVQAWNKEEPKKAFEFFSQAAKLGNGLAHHYLGLLYRAGEGVRENLSLAAQWFGAAVEKGVLAAYVELGVLYLEGNGVKKDWAVAKSLFQRCLNSPETLEMSGYHGSCQRYLDMVNKRAVEAYSDGINLLGSNTQADDQLAVEQFRLAASLDHEDAQRVLKECFSSTAEGVEKTGTCQFSPTVPEQAKEESKAGAPNGHKQPAKNQANNLKQHGKFATQSEKPAVEAGAGPTVARKGK